MTPRRLRVPAEPGDPELHAAGRDDPMQFHRAAQQRAHLRQIAERHVVRAIRLAERPVERVRMVSPDVEVRLVAARAVRTLPVREAQHRPHERQRSNRVPGLRLVPERVEPAGHNEVRLADGVNRSSDRVHHAAVDGRLRGRQILAEVRLVPDLEDVYGRRIVVAVEVERERLGELLEQ